MASNPSPHLSSEPASTGYAVTPDDGNDLEHLTRGIYTGSGGDIAVHMKGADGAYAPVTLAGTAGGIVLPIRTPRILSTGTAATGIVALY